MNLKDQKRIAALKKKKRFRIGRHYLHYPKGSLRYAIMKDGNYMAETNVMTFDNFLEIMKSFPVGEIKYSGIEYNDDTPAFDCKNV